MNLKLLLPAILFIGILMTGVHATAGDIKTSLTPTCTLHATTFTDGTGYRTNTTVIYNVTTNINWTNATSRLKVGALEVPVNLGTELIHDAEATATNGTEWKFATSDLNDGNYAVVGRLYFDNYTNNTKPDLNTSLSAYTVACTSRSISVLAESGSGLTAVVAQQQQQQEQTSQRNTMLVIVAIIAAVALFGMKKRR